MVSDRDEKLMALPLSMFTKGLLITTPPCIYIFMGDIPVNSLFGAVASVSQDMSSDDTNALPQEDSNVLPSAPVDSLGDNALPPSNPVVVNGTSQDSKSGISTGDPVVSNEVANNSNPGISTSDSVVVDDIARESAPKASTGEPEVSKELSQEGAPGVTRSDSTVDSGASENSKPGVSNGLSDDSVPIEDDHSEVDDEDEDDEEQEPKPDTSKNEELNKRLGEAGIDSSCFLPNLQTVGKCELDKDQMEKINFPQKDDTDDEDFEISGMDSDEKVTLTIESGYDEENDFPKGGLRLTFRNTNSQRVKITGSASNDTDLEPNIDYDFKFSTTIDNWLDRAWKSLQRIGARVGLNINDSLSDDECAPGKEINKEINVWKNEKEYVKGALSASGSQCLMKHESDVENLLEGFKLTVKGNEDISLTGGEGPRKGRKIDTLKKNVSYSIAPKRIKGEMVWFLIENS